MVGRDAVLLAGALGVGGLLWAAWTSWRKKEALASRRILLLAVGLLAWIVGAGYLPGWGGAALTWGLGAVGAFGLLLLLPFPGRSFPASSSRYSPVCSSTMS